MKNIYYNKYSKNYSLKHNISVVKSIMFCFLYNNGKEIYSVLWFKTVASSKKNLFQSQIKESRLIKSTSSIVLWILANAEYTDDKNGIQKRFPVI